MCEVGMRVRVEDAVDEVGGVVHANTTGIVIGHLGMKWAIVSLDGEASRTVLVPEGRARPISGQPKGRAVVVRPSGKVTPLSREDSKRVHVR